MHWQHHRMRIEFLCFISSAQDFEFVVRYTLGFIGILDIFRVMTALCLSGLNSLCTAFWTDRILASPSIQVGLRIPVRVMIVVIT
jgi:hypothetical protein